MARWSDGHTSHVPKRGAPEEPLVPLKKRQSTSAALVQGPDPLAPPQQLEGNVAAASDPLSQPLFDEQSDPNPFTMHGQQLLPASQAVAALLPRQGDTLAYRAYQ